MKNKNLQLNLIEDLDNVVARIEEMVVDSTALTRINIDILKNDIRALYKVVCEIERTELESPITTVHKMKDSVSELKKKLTALNSTPTDTSEEPVFRPVLEEELLAEEPTIILAQESDSDREEIFLPEKEADTEIKSIEEPKTEEELAPVITQFTEPEPEFLPEPEPEPEPESKPEPDLSEFIPRAEDEPTSYVTSLTAMAQAQAGEQDMSQVAVSSTAMPDESVVRQVENRSDIFTKLKETEALPISQGQNSLKSLVDRLKTNKTVNDVHQTPIADFRSLIGINEKFLFINELFKGNIKEYSDMLQSLDTAQDGQEMNLIMQPLAEKYNWNEQSLAYITLSDLLKKRFGAEISRSSDM